VERCSLIDRVGRGTVLRGEHSFSPKPQVRLPVSVVEATVASHHNRRRGVRPSVRGSDCEAAEVRLSTSIAAPTSTEVDNHRPAWAGSKDEGSVSSRLLHTPVVHLDSYISRM
jgi:hypothetical protein